MAKFAKGQSGNPAGRRKGVKDRRTALREKLEPHAEDLIETVVTFARAGDPTAMRLCIERLMPPIKEAPIHFALPKIAKAEDVAAAQAAVLTAVAAGDLLPGEAQVITSLLEAQRRAFDSSDLSKRLEAIEAALERQGTLS